MTIMRSETKTLNSDWFGIKESGITEFRDDSDRFDWADIYIVIEMRIQGSKYTRPCKITGSFEKDEKGKIKDGSLLKRITYMCEALGWDGGVNQYGQWVDGDEKPIDDIAGYLTEQFGQGEEAPLNYVCYVFREAGKDGKVYTRIHNKFMQNKPGNKEQLTSYIDWLRKNKYIREVPVTDEEDPTANNQASSMKMDGVNVSNL